jgi:hypothetical protein
MKFVLDKCRYGDSGPLLCHCLDGAHPCHGHRYVGVDGRTIHLMRFGRTDDVHEIAVKKIV